MNQVRILGLCLGVALAASYISWSADDDPTDEAAIALYAAPTGSVRAVQWQHGAKRLTVEAKEDAVGAYVWVTATQPPPGQPDAPAVTQQFLGNAGAEDFLAALEPLHASRSLGTLGDAQQASFGLDEDDHRLEIQVGDTSHRLRLGSEAYGTRDHYALTDDSELVLLARRTMAPLEEANRLFVERRLQPLQASETPRITLHSSKGDWVFDHHHADDSQRAYWAHQATPDTQEPAASVWFEKLYQLPVLAYPEAPPEQGERVLAAELEGPERTWTLVLVQSGDDWFVQSPFNRGTVQVVASQAQELVDDLPNLAPDDDTTPPR